MSSDGARRVAVVLGELDPETVSGATRSLLKAIPELERRGWEFDFWTEVPSATAAWLSAEGHRVSGARRLVKFSLRQLRTAPGPRARLGSLPGYLAEFRRFLRASAPDAVLGNTVGTLPELALAKISGHPTVLHVLEILPDRPKYRLATRGMGLVSDEIMVPSRATATQFDGRGRPPTVVYTGIEPPSHEAVASARAGRSAPNEVVVGALGTISARKGTDVLVEAAERLRGSAIALSWRLCGRCIEGAERPDAEALLERAIELGFVYEDHVRPFEELPRWDILVLPSRVDPFPNVVLEAMAVGVPVIGTRTGGVPEQLADGAGVIVPPDDAAALAAAIERLARDVSRRERIAATARERVERLFSITSQADATAAVLTAAIDRRADDRRRGLR